MSNSKMRGISLVRYIKEYSKPDRKEILVKHEFQVRCNAAIPLDHYQFQNQFLFKNSETVKSFSVRKDKDKGKGIRQEPKYQKHRNSYVG